MVPLRAAVVGAGHLGRFHAEKYAASTAARLVAVVDVDRQRARDVTAAMAGVTILDDHRRLAGLVDVASVAVPTRLHHAVTRDLLDAGIDVLVEKPFTATSDEGRDLIQRAERLGRVLQVGHVERFNPAIRALCERVEAPMFIEASRIAPFTPRGTDVDVVLDLMIHDIDLVLQLVDAPLRRIDASGGSILTTRIDIANARLQFGNGCVANLTASRVSGKSERVLRVFQRHAYFSADLGARSLKACVQDAPMGADPAASIRVEQVAPAPGDALADEIADFLRCVRDGARPLVSGRDGLRALEVATEVLARIAATPFRPGSAADAMAAA
jgi:predicted dehydrogenase